MSASPSQSSNLSASPAALFLSAFSSPTATYAPLPDDEGQVVAGYTLGGIIGYGATSIIRRACSPNGGVVAVKIVRRSDLVKAGNAPQARKRLQHEASIWSSLSHEHILPLFSVVHSSYADYFVTLLCPAGSLFDILKRDGRPALPQDDAGMMFRQVVRGLRYLHEIAMFVHRDMKLENVLVDEMGVCRIGDFGMTRKIGEIDEDDQLQAEQHDTPPDNLHHPAVHRAMSLAVPSSKRRTSFQLHQVARHNTTRHRNSTSNIDPAHAFQPGSLPYAPPELLLPQTADAMRPHPCQDIWALGVMLYTLLTGRLPFSDSFEPRLQMKILNGNSSLHSLSSHNAVAYWPLGEYEVPTDIGRGAERILKGCLERQISNRWTIAMVDEIAWGVGWGAEGDDATHGESDDDLELECERASTSQSRSHSRPAELSIPDISNWQQEEPRSRSALDAASRRSSSRAKRSQSRAPVVTPSTRASNRSMSRHSRAPSPSRISISTSIPIPNLSSTTSSPFSSSPSSAVERGRKPNKSHTTSRSPSPSIVPTTPADIESLFHPPTVLEQPDELDLDSPRDNGRSLRSIRRGDLYAAGHQREDTRDVPPDWSAELGKKPIPEDQESLSSSGQDETNHHARRSARSSRDSSLAPSRRKRPASTQPASTKSWARDQERVIAAPLVQKHSVESFLNHFRGLPASGRVNRGRSMDRE